MVDHIHFQYNGMLLGVLVWSLSFAANRNFIASALLFSVAVCLKHLFVFAAPVYFTFMLRYYCLQSNSLTTRAARFVSLALTVVAVVTLTFLPFLLHGQMPIVLARLFPFGRGLLHAYWAPNAYALLAGADKTLVIGLKALGIKWLRNPKAGSLTGGLVGSGAGFAILPDVSTPFNHFTFY